MNKLMAANWKMHKTIKEAEATASELLDLLSGKLPEDRDVLIIPPFTALKAAADILLTRLGYSVGAQNLYPEEKGAFTGEISPSMIKEAGGRFALAGHSERRHVMGEPDDFVGKKVGFGLSHGLAMILCIGETIDERKAGEVEDVLKRHLDTGLAEVPADVNAEEIVVAYEPVWAIGTGEVAKPSDIVEAHGFVRKELEEKFGPQGNAIRILYGGSVKPDNATEIMGLDNVDGVLVGGASLQADSFSKIVTA
jgi:triosephosphate isomerase